MRGPAGSQSDFSVRGSTFQQVLVILDGVRLNDPNTGHFNSYIPIAPAEIERIEVLKGASSALYGSEAVGGVIHIITRSFAAKQGEQQKDLLLQTSVGEFGLINVNAGGFYQKKKTALSIGVLSANAEGQPQRGTSGYFHNTTVSASLKQYISQYWDVAFRSAYDSRDFAAQNFYTTFLSDTANEQVKTVWNQLRIGYKKNRSRLSIAGGYKATDDTYQFNSVGLPNKSKSKLGQGSVIYNYTRSEQLNYIVGIQYQNKSINSNDRGKHHLSQAAGFISLNYTPVKHFSINPALRIDWIEGIGTELVPQVNLSYRLNKWQLRGSAGKTIRDADFTERFNNYNKLFVASGRIGNPDLDPERSISYEVGADYLLSNTLKISTTVFQRYQTKLIDYVNTPYAQMPRKENLSPTGTYALARNISKVTTTGAELDIQFVKNFSNKQSLWATAGFLWLDDNSSSGTPSLYISSHAKYLVNFNVQYKINWLSIAMNGLYKKRNAQAASAINAIVAAEYFVLNSRLEAMILKNRLSLFIQADNLFDKNYQDILGSQMPGRWLMGGLKINLR